jgi:hypothetical protein
MSDWYRGLKLMELWEIEDFELLSFMMQGLQPYDEFLRPISPPNIIGLKRQIQGLESAIVHLDVLYASDAEFFLKRARYDRYGDTDYSTTKSRLEGELVLKKNAYPWEDEYSWTHCILPRSEPELLAQRQAIRQYLFKREDVEAFSLEHDLKLPTKSKNSQSTSKQAKKKLRTCQEDKNKCREIAKQKWKEDSSLTIVEEDSSLTIVEVVKCEEIKKQFGSMYKPRTIYKWIKDLAPNRKPGRRPTKKK